MFLLSPVESCPDNIEDSSQTTRDSFEITLNKGKWDYILKRSLKFKLQYSFTEDDWSTCLSRNILLIGTFYVARGDVFTLKMRCVGHFL